MWTNYKTKKNANLRTKNVKPRAVFHSIGGSKPCPGFHMLSTLQDPLYWMSKCWQCDSYVVNIMRSSALDHVMLTTWFIHRQHYEIHCTGSSKVWEFSPWSSFMLGHYEWLVFARAAVPWAEEECIQFYFSPSLWKWSQNRVGERKIGQSSLIFSHGWGREGSRNWFVGA